jgi:hypothetical protein
MSGRVRGHIRTNVVGYVALFFALSGGAAWATHPGGENTISTIDIQDGEVKKDDLGGNSVVTGKIADGAVGTADLAASSVTSGKVANDSLTALDLATNSVGKLEINEGAFLEEDIDTQFLPNFGSALAIPPNAIQSDEISDQSIGSADLGPGSVGSSEVANGAIQRVDLADEAQGPLGFEFSDDDTGIICNQGCTEGTLGLPPGFYMIFGKIRAFQDNDENPLLAVDCELSSGGAAFDHASVTTETTETFAPLTSATLSMQGARLFIERGGVNLNCRDFDVGDASGFDLKIDAIKLGAFG